MFFFKTKPIRSGIETLCRLYIQQSCIAYLQIKFSTLIADVASTGNSGSGVFDPDRKCFHGIMSRKLTVEGKDIAKYFVPAAEIREFLPPEFRY